MANQTVISGDSNGASTANVEFITPDSVGKADTDDVGTIILQFTIPANTMQDGDFIDLDLGIVQYSGEASE